MPQSSETISARGRTGRILITAPAKAGKTVCAIATAPAPVYAIGWDGEGSLDGAQEFSPYQFDFDHPSSISQMEGFLRFIEQNAAKYQTCVIDGITTMCEKCFAEVARTSKNPDPRSHYGDSNTKLLDWVNRLIALPIHLIATGHSEGSAGDLAGNPSHQLLINGKLKSKIAGKFQDWVYLQVSVDASKPADDPSAVRREFLTQPQGAWPYGSRSIRNVARVPADITKFLELAEAQATGSSSKKTNSATNSNVRKIK